MVEQDIGALLGIASAVLGTVLAYLKRKKVVSETQSQIIFQYAEKALAEAQMRYPDEEFFTRANMTLGKLKEGWYDESVSTEELKAILTIWSDYQPRVRKLKEF